MSEFAFYFNLGWKHIISTDALDHILFIIALCAIYLVSNWKQVLILVTAFTIGHSITLALSTYDIIRFDTSWVEFLIPLTILITSVLNLSRNEMRPGYLKLNYFLALFFGLIHGMGFANTIRFILGKSDSIAMPLFSFNVGLEAGQLVIVAIILALAYIIVNLIGLKRIWWTRILSVTTLLASAYICVQRWPL